MMWVVYRITGCQVALASCFEDAVKVARELAGDHGITYCVRRWAP